MQKQTVGGDRPWWVSLVSSWLGPMLEGWIADFVRSKIEREFDPQDFLEGATDAFFTGGFRVYSRLRASPFLTDGGCYSRCRPWGKPCRRQACAT